MGEGKLVLETDFAGGLTIDWGSVERFSTDAPLTFVLEDGSILKGQHCSAEQADAERRIESGPLDD